VPSPTIRGCNPATVACLEQRISDAAINGQFAGVVVVARGDKVLLKLAYGIDPKHTKPMRPETPLNAVKMGY
jgi:hypothetical protein